jgi:hypothetical protein
MGPAGGTAAPTEEEMRAAYEAELSRITVTDMMAQAAVSLLNMAARRLAPPGAPAGAQAGAGPGSGERDLEQARDAIDGVRALVAILERRIPEEMRPLRDALSQLQMAYAAEARGAGESPGAGAPEDSGEPAGSPPAERAQDGDRTEPADPQSGKGPAQASGRLWVPGS